jgi:hypothetical protein
VTALRLKHIRSADPELKRLVREEALARGVTMNDVIWEILDRAFRNGGNQPPYEPSGEKTMGAEPDSPNFRLRLPDWIHAEIWQRARTEKWTESSYVQSVVAEYFGLPYAPVRRAGGRKKQVAQ